MLTSFFFFFFFFCSQGARHIAKDITGQNVANPTAMLLSATLMLRHLGLEDHASRIQRAVHQVLKYEGTPDVAGGSATTTEFTKKVIAYLN
jgi:isocitrate dehydrogenase (NAD+)